MSNRISKVVTRTGDDGTTGLADGSRVAKTAPRVEAMGDVDELNSCLGWLQAQGLDAALTATLREIQHRLFDIGGELALPGSVLVGVDHVQALDNWIETHNRDLPPLREFILPGGDEAASRCHLARAICRRCERQLFRLAETEAVNPASTIYVNRLSDLLFILARILARRAGGTEIYWRKGT